LRCDEKFIRATAGQGDREGRPYYTTELPGRLWARATATWY